MEFETREKQEEEDTSSVSLSEDESSPPSMVQEGFSWFPDGIGVGGGLRQRARRQIPYPPAKPRLNKGLFVEINTKSRKRTKSTGVVVFGFVKIPLKKKKNVKICGITLTSMVRVLNYATATKAPQDTLIFLIFFFLK